MSASRLGRKDVCYKFKHIRILNSSHFPPFQASDWLICTGPMTKGAGREVTSRNILGMILGPASACKGGEEETLCSTPPWTRCSKCNVSGARVLAVEGCTLALGARTSITPNKVVSMARMPSVKTEIRCVRCKQKAGRKRHSDHETHDIRKISAFHKT